MKADAQTDAQVRAALATMIDAYARRDLHGVLASFAPDADVMIFGTGVDEKRIGPAQIRAQVERDWAQSERASMSFDWISVSAADAVAWAAGDGRFDFRAGGADGTMPARVSFVLERRDGRWLIVHAHFSTPAADEAEGESF